MTTVSAGTPPIPTPSTAPTISHRPERHVDASRDTERAGTSSTEAGDGERALHRGLYRRLPEMTCRTGCSDCCGPTPLSPWEARRLGIEGAITTPVHPGTATCAFLVDGRCSVYERRPFACRLYGTTPAAPCPHGAAPSPAKTVSVPVAIELFDRFESTCPPDWHEARHRAVRTVVDRDGSDAERASLDAAEAFRDRGRRFLAARSARADEDRDR